MASLRLSFAEHEFKEARSASFRIFQLVFGCVYVCLACMSRVQISCDLEFLFVFFMCLHGCLVMFKM